MPAAVSIHDSYLKVNEDNITILTIKSQFKRLKFKIKPGIFSLSGAAKRLAIIWLYKFWECCPWKVIVVHENNKFWLRSLKLWIFTHIDIPILEIGNKMGQFWSNYNSLTNWIPVLELPFCSKSIHTIDDPSVEWYILTISKWNHVDSICYMYNRVIFEALVINILR